MPETYAFCIQMRKICKLDITYTHSDILLVQIRIIALLVHSRKLYLSESDLFAEV